MGKWLLVVAYEKSNFASAQKEWLKRDIFLTLVPTIEDAIRELPSHDYIAIAVFGDDHSYVTFIPEARKIKPNIPVICMASDYDQQQEELLRHLESVVYMVWPGDLEESVKMGYQAIKDNTSIKESKPDERLEYKDLELYPQYRKVFFMGTEVNLSMNQFKTLKYLLSNKGKPLTFDQIYDHVYGEYAEPESIISIVRHFVGEIRRKVRAVGPFDYIKNERGFGFRIGKCEK